MHGHVRSAKKHLCLEISSATFLLTALARTSFLSLRVQTFLAQEQNPEMSLLPFDDSNPPTN